LNLGILPKVLQNTLEADSISWYDKARINLLGANRRKVVDVLAMVVDLTERRRIRQNVRAPVEQALPRVLSALLAAGATEFTKIALEAWGRSEIEPKELLELCQTYASVAGLEPHIAQNLT
jgi:hypothetical protein